jgi:hypothetical protein
VSEFIVQILAIATPGIGGPDILAGLVVTPQVFTRQDHSRVVAAVGEFCGKDVSRITKTLDAETKSVPAFKVANRDAATVNAFMQDVASRGT